MRHDRGRTCPYEVGVGGVEKALDALWSGYASRARRLLSPRWMAELRLRARFDLEPVDVRRLAVDVPKDMVPECEGCPDICCAGAENLVSLRLRDLAVLIDLGRTDLVRRQKPRFPAALVASRPHLAVLQDSRLFRALPVLAQVGPERRCAALAPNLKCTLHPHWPLSCARFPYTMSEDKRRVRWGSRCPAPSRGAPGRGAELVTALIRSYDERVRDAVLLAHARPELDRLGLGPYLCGDKEDPFEAPPRLPVLD